MCLLFIICINGVYFAVHLMFIILKYIFQYIFSHIGIKLYKTDNFPQKKSKTCLAVYVKFLYRIGVSFCIISAFRPGGSQSG